jgi:phosphatidylglycerophosphatase C
MMAGSGAGGGEAAGPTVAAFDFDGTLVRGDSLLPFLLLACGAPSTARALAVQVGPTLASLARSGHPDRDLTKARILARLLAGRRQEDLLPLAEAYGARLAGRLRPAMRARLEHHRAAGHILVIVSASPELYVTPAGRRLGVDAVLATRLAVGLDGRLTGRIEGANCRGEEKTARLRAWLGCEPGVLHAYGDSAGDAHLLAMADTPCWVGHRAALASRRPGARRTGTRARLR